MTMNSIDEAAQSVEYSFELIGPDLISSCIDKDTSQKLSYATIKAGFTYCMGNNGGMIKVTEGWGEVSVANDVVVEGSGLNGIMCDSAIYITGMSDNILRITCSV